MQPVIVLSWLACFDAQRATGLHGRV